MNEYEEIIKLRRLFKEIEKASESNDVSYPFAFKLMEFKSNMKNFLYRKFGDDIVFEADDSISYIGACYRGADIGIDMYDGITLSIFDSSSEARVFRSFNPILSGVMGNPICKYYVGPSSDDMSLYPVYEWSLHPMRRLTMIKEERFNPYGRFEFLEDYYTVSLIKSLGDDLLTLDGYIVLFDGNKDDKFMKNEIVKLIDEVRPDIGYSDIIKWIKDSKRQLSRKQVPSKND